MRLLQSKTFALTLTWALFLGCLGYGVIAGHHLQGCGESTSGETQFLVGGVAAWGVAVLAVTALFTLGTRRLWVVAAGLLGLAAFLLSAPLLILGSCGEPNWADDILSYGLSFAGSTLATAAALSFLIGTARGAGRTVVGPWREDAGGERAPVSRLVSAVAFLALVFVALIALLFAYDFVVGNAHSVVMPLILLALIGAAIAYLAGRSVG